MARGVYLTEARPAVSRAMVVPAFAYEANSLSPLRQARLLPLPLPHSALARPLPDEIDAHGDVAVAAVRVEALGAHGELHQRDVRGVHALQTDAARAQVPAGLRDEVLERLQHLLQQRALNQPRLEHPDGENRKLFARFASRTSL